MSAQIVPNLPFEDYLARPALSVSRLKMFAKAPALVNFAKEETAAMRMGSLVHCAVLEPGQLFGRYYPVELDRTGTRMWEICALAAREGFAGLSATHVVTDANPGTKAWKAIEADGFKPCTPEENDEACAIADCTPGGGRELVKRADYDAALRMRDAVWADPQARPLIEGCETEVSAFWVDPETGLACKGRADIVNRSIRAIGDIKTTCDASPRAFARDFEKLMYGFQDVFYRDGFLECGEEFDFFFFVAVEKETNLVKVHYLNPEQIHGVRAVMRDYMEEYAECLGRQEWPGYGEELNEITLPDWALQRKRPRFFGEN